MRKTLVAAAVLLGLVALVAIARFGLGGSAVRQPGLSGDDRAGFIRSAVEACVTARKGSAEDAALPASVIDSYCGCYAERLASSTTPDEFARLSSADSAAIQQAMRPKMEQASEACADGLAIEAPAEAK